jgi:hypothetical protein
MAVPFSDATPALLPVPPKVFKVKQNELAFWGIKSVKN